MNDKRLNICVDIDGTITSPYYFLPYLNKLLGTDVGEEEYLSTDWNKVFGKEHAPLFKHFDELCPESYDVADLLEGADKYINKLAESSNIYFVTARKKCLYERTLLWLKNNGLEKFKTYMLGHNNKRDIAKDLNCDIFVEDNPENAHNLAEAGFRVILMDTKYNRELRHDNITRVNSWKEIYRIIQDLGYN